MKFNKISGPPAAGVRRRGRLSQLLLVSIIGLAVAMLLSACQLVTIDYVYLASIKDGAGVVESFAADSQSGALRNGPASVSSGGNNPVAMAVSPNYANLYVGNADNNTVVHFAIDSNGVLTKKDSVTLATAPAALAVNATGSYLYVASGTTSANLTEYALSSGTIGSAVAQESLVLPEPAFANDIMVPTGVNVLVSEAGVYVSAYDKSAYNPGNPVTSTANPGWVFGFAVGSGGALSPSQDSPYHTGVKPSALISDPTSRYVYVTDFASNSLVGYGVTSGSTLNFLVSGPYKTGNEPSAIAIDARGKYIYVANALDSSVNAYAIDLATGIPSAVINTTGSQINATDSVPVSLVVDPALARFVYTANFLGNSISGFQINPDTGAIHSTQSTPYPSGTSHPTSIVCIPHGNHSIQAPLS